MPAFVTVSLRFQAQGVATIQLFLCLPFPNVSMEMQPVDTPLSLPFPLCASLCSFGGASPPALFFYIYIYISDDTCGRIREQDRGVGGPRWIQRLISHMAAELHKYICCKNIHTNRLIRGESVLIYCHLFNCFSLFFFFPSPLFSTYAHTCSLCWTDAQTPFCLQVPSLDSGSWLTSAVMW